MSYSQKDAGVFIQFQPGGNLHYLGNCINIDSIDNPRWGGRDLRFCWNNTRTGYTYTGESLSPPSAIEYDIEDLMLSVASWLERAAEGGCPFVIYINLASCEDHSVFDNFERGFGLFNTRILNDPIGTLVHRRDDNEMTHTFNVSSVPPRMDYYSLVASRQTTSETMALNAVTVCPVQYCGVCGALAWIGEHATAVADADTGVTANVLETVDAGTTWAATAADPFAVDEDILSVVCFPISRGVVRYIVIRESDPANPLEIAYSDDGGATWTLVTVGATNGETVTGPKAMVALDWEHIWIVTDQGTVFFSADGGVNWTDQDATGVSGGNPLNALSMVDIYVGFAVGDSDTVIYTNDGGQHWLAATATGTGDDLLAVQAFDSLRVLIGTDGTAAATTPLWMSYDGCATYEERYFVGWATEEVTSISFYDDLNGLIITNTAGPVGSIHHTVNGGQTFRELDTTPTNSGLNDVIMYGRSGGYAVGEANGGTAVIVAIGLVNPATS